LPGALPAWAGGAELRESLAQAAAQLPGYGQPDLYFPATFLGSWQCGRELVAMEESAAPAAEDLMGGLKGVGDGRSSAVRAAGPDGGALVGAAQQDAKVLLHQPLSYRVRFIEANGRVVADRAFNELNKAKVRFRRGFC